MRRIRQRLAAQAFGRSGDCATVQEHEVDSKGRPVEVESLDVEVATLNWVSLFNERSVSWDAPLATYLRPNSNLMY